MSILKTIAGVTAGTAMCLSAAMADDHAPTMSMISLMEIDPAKTEQFDEAWSTIREIATESDYPYTDHFGAWRNERWIATPLKNYADVDALIETRTKVETEGGRRFERALERFYDAMTNSHAFFIRYDDDLSYAAEGSDVGPFMEIDTYHYRYGADDEMRAILSGYKALMAAKNSPYGYDVSWDTIGSVGNSVTVVSYAENAVAMAERNAAIDAMLEGDEAAEALFERFLAISTGSDTMHSWYAPDASINAQSGE